MELWHVWAIIALLFLIIEIFTTGFAVACFSFGCIAAAVCAACSLSLTWQILAFALVSGIAFVTVRPLIIKFFFKPDREVLTNADAIIGREARVSEKIDPASGSGRVAIDGDDWKAVSADGGVIKTGTIVEIVSRESIVLTVKTK